MQALLIQFFFMTQTSPYKLPATRTSLNNKKQYRLQALLTIILYDKKYHHSYKLQPKASPYKFQVQFFFTTKNITIQITSSRMLVQFIQFLRQKIYYTNYKRFSYNYKSSTIQITSCTRTVSLYDKKQNRTNYKPYLYSSS